MTSERFGELKDFIRLRSGTTGSQDWDAYGFVVGQYPPFNDVQIHRPLPVPFGNKRAW